MTSRARWAADARDLTNDIVAAANYFTIGQVSDMTGLSPKTIADPLTRQEINNKENPRGALCRPAARIGDVPLWSQEQLDEFARRKKALGKAEKSELPVVSVKEASERGLVSTREVAAMFNHHDQTVRRWERYDKNYPPKVARRARENQSGQCEHLRKREQVIAWAESAGIEIPASAL